MLRILHRFFAADLFLFLSFPDRKNCVVASLNSRVIVRRFEDRNEFYFRNVIRSDIHITSTRII